MVKIAIVGAGGISNNHIKSIIQFDDAKIIGVVDLNRQNAERQAALCGASVFDKLSDCLDKVDMVWVLTPPSTHRAIAVEAIQAGKHVVVEKPITASIEDAEIMTAEAKKHKVKLMTAFCCRFRTGFMKLKEFVESGKIGTPTTYWCQRHGLRVDPANKWSTDPMLMTGMSIQSLSHDIDMMRWIAGEVLDVSAIVQESRPNLPGFDDNSNAIFHLASGASANFQSSWSSHSSFNTRGMLGTKGTAYVGGNDLWGLDFFRYKTHDMAYEATEFIRDPHDIRSFTREDRYFIDCVIKDIEPTVTGEDGLKALKVSYGILESSRTGKTIKLVY
jgi:myo-inositol 2-dehydrogenase/D-chiro-inositol 1-dehydrogenase